MFTEPHILGHRFNVVAAMWWTWANLSLGHWRCGRNVVAQRFALFAVVMGYLNRCITMVILTMQCAFRSSITPGHLLHIL